MPCYHDYITDNAVSYGGSVMNLSCDNHDVLENLSNVSANGPIFSFLGVIFVTPIEFTVGVGMAPLFFASLAILLIFAPDEANKMWEQFMYFVNPNLKDFHEIYKKVDNSTQKGVSVLSLFLLTWNNEAWKECASNNYWNKAFTE